MKDSKTDTTMLVSSVSRKTMKKICGAKTLGMMGRN